MTKFTNLVKLYNFNLYIQIKNKIIYFIKENTNNKKIKIKKNTQPKIKNIKNISINFIKYYINYYKINYKKKKELV